MFNQNQYISLLLQAALYIQVSQRAPWSPVGH
jgi:hypothetical protein